MNLNKSYEFFQPEKAKSRIHIIGCGSVGSTVAELLTRYGCQNITLYDFDFVESHNLVNQMFTADQVGKPKVEAVRELMVRINPDIAQTVKIVPEGYQGQRLAGYVFLCVDNIDLRREIVEKNQYNGLIDSMYDFRTRLTDAQHYAANWHEPSQVKSFLNSMQFSHEEASEVTPMSACHVSLAVPTTVRMICELGVNNFVNHVKGNPLKKMILVDGFQFELTAF